MRLGNFSLEIPQGHELESGYVAIRHNTTYTIKLSNFGDRPCDAEVEVDGKIVGTWRIYSNKDIELERPAHDTGKFTFYKLNSLEADKVGLAKNEKLGLVSVLFKPEIPPKPFVNTRFKFSISNDSLSAGGTGLFGKSEQKFTDVRPLDYDKSGFVHIHLRLGACEAEEPRPLTPASTPIPPPLL